MLSRQNSLTAIGDPVFPLSRVWQCIHRMLLQFGVRLPWLTIC